MMKVGISFSHACRVGLALGGSKTERIKERMIELDLIEKPVNRWRLKEMNMKIVLHYKIHRTRKKREPRNWMEFEIDISTIIEPNRKSPSEVVNDMALTCDEIAAEFLGGYQFDGISPDNVDTSNYETEDTEEPATYPEVKYEMLFRSSSRAVGVFTRKGTRRL